MNNLKLRQAKITDLPVLMGLYNDLNYSEDHELTLEQASQIFLQMQTIGGHCIYVLTNETKVVASFVLTILPYLVHGGRSAGVLEDVVVDSTCRSMGIGKEILNKAILICKEAGCYKLSLSSNIQREKAHAFYLEQGFKQHGISFAMELCNEESYARS